MPIAMQKINIFLNKLRCTKILNGLSDFNIFLCTMQLLNKRNDKRDFNY